MLDAAVAINHYTCAKLYEGLLLPQQTLKTPQTCMIPNKAYVHDKQEPRINRHLYQTWIPISESHLNNHKQHTAPTASENYYAKTQIHKSKQRYSVPMPEIQAAGLAT
jgi:hypothetical protein